MNDNCTSYQMCFGGVICQPRIQTQWTRASQSEKRYTSKDLYFKRVWEPIGRKSLIYLDLDAAKLTWTMRKPIWYAGEIAPTTRSFSRIFTIHVKADVESRPFAPCLDKNITKRFMAKGLYHYCAAWSWTCPWPVTPGGLRDRWLDQNLCLCQQHSHG